jgi:hypothetical protein
MITLLVIYSSFHGHTFYTEYQVPTTTCQAQARSIRAKVRVGRVWLYCGGTKV